MNTERYLELFGGLDLEFKQITQELQALFSFAGLAVGGRGTHTDGIFATGRLTVLAGRDIPPNALFRPGMIYEIILRHANIVGGGDDDRFPNGRGLAIRIAEPGSDLAQPQLQDLVLNTGEVFGLATARLYREFFTSSFAAKSEMLASGALSRVGVEGALRNPISYTEVYYHSQLCYEWVVSRGVSSYARFRVTAPEQTSEGGRLEPGVEIGARLVLPLQRGDERDPHYLRKEFQSRLRGGGHVEYLLQAQFRTIATDALDCTRAWDPTTFPWMDVASIQVDSDASGEPRYQDIAFNPGNSHSALRFPSSRSADDFASLGMSGALVHYVGARVRAEQTQYLYGPVAGLPGIPQYLPLPIPEVPSSRYLFLRQLLPDQEVSKDGGRAAADRITNSMPVTALDIAVGSTKRGKIPNDYFIERRLNGYCPGAVRDADEGMPYSHLITHDLTGYELKASFGFPGRVECRFESSSSATQLHSISIDNKAVHPGHSGWEEAKRSFLQAEFVAQELKLHLGRCHLNVEQYALAIKRRLGMEHPVRKFIEPHLEGLIFINKVGLPKITGSEGFITIASSLTRGSIQRIMRDELAKLSYTWDPREGLPLNAVYGDRFAPAVRSFWEMLDEYVTAGLLREHASEIDTQESVKQVAALFEELRARSIYGGSAPPEFDASELKHLVMYILYHSMFLHSWANFKQYDDAGNPEHVSMGDYASYGTVAEGRIRVAQRNLTWILSSVRYNPAAVFGSDLLKQLIQARSPQMEPGLPLKDIMMSINI